MPNKKLALIAILAGVAASNILAGAPPDSISNFAVGDVLVCFRTGVGDMVVDAGPISTFTSATHNQVIPITQYTGTQLAVVGTNGMSWSAFAWQGDNTLFMSRPRSSVGQQGTPWNSAGSSQSGVVGQMKTIPPGALDELNVPVYAQSTPTAVIEEDQSDDNVNYTDGQSYHTALTGSYGSDWDGKFQGNPENTTAGNFVANGVVARSDFYQLSPTSSAQGTWLGYFELNTNGAMSFVAYPSTMPVINNYSRAGSTGTITYKTGLYGTYSLLATNNISAPQSTWPVIANLSAGDTLSHTVQDTDTTSNKFYIIQGQ